MKTLALFGMLCAHCAIAAGYAELNYLLFFWVYPLFAAIAGINAVKHTSNPNKYALRLFTWAIITQPIHVWFFGPELWYVPNVLFGLSAVVYIVSRCQRIPELKIPSWAFYALYPLHFIIIKSFHHLVKFTG